jgi:hypothetical protein
MARWSYLSSSGLAITGRISIPVVGFRVGLHPAAAHGPAPGTTGGITVGLAVDEPIVVVEKLKDRGVTFAGQGPRRHLRWPSVTIAGSCSHSSPTPTPTPMAPALPR